MNQVESFAPEKDEERIWLRAQEIEEVLDESGFIYDDPILAAYVNQVAEKLVPPDVADKGVNISVRIIRNPLLNAFAFPNGVVYVHTGILARMENEAQLAALLGHEMTHVTHRHSIESIRSVKNVRAVLATLQVAGMPFGVYGDLASLVGEVGARAAVSGYSRDHEREADREGLRVMVAAGYDPREAPKLFEHMKRDVEEDGDRKEPFFFGSHPKLEERIASYHTLLRYRYPGQDGLKKEKEFREKTRRLRLDNAFLDLALGRYGAAERAFRGYLEVGPGSAAAHYGLGELYRQRGEQGDRERAEGEYRLSLRYDPVYPEPHKSLGLLFFKEKDVIPAKRALEQYLMLAPEAADRGYIEQYLKQCRTLEQTQ
jgi:predicted Zn-dependent protease